MKTLFVWEIAAIILLCVFFQLFIMFEGAIWITKKKTENFNAREKPIKKLYDFSIIKKIESA